MNDSEKQRNAYIVLCAGIFFNLTICVLYVWSLLRVMLTAPVAEGGWGWTSGQAGLPYTLIIVFFATGVLIGGRIQDKVGPRWVATAGGACVGLGLILSGLIGNNATGIALCFGVITGMGMGLGYGSVLPAALKWFHPGRKGFVSGMILGGFGLASLHYAPTTNALLNNFGISNTFLYLGIAVALISVPISQLVKNPPADYVPPEAKNVKQSSPASRAPVDFTWNEMLRTKRFYLMFIIFVLSASIGLMMIGNIANIAGLQAGVTNAAFLIGYVAIMNTLGRIVGGITSDKIGRENTLLIAIILQMINMIAFVHYQNMAMLVIGFTLVGACFGIFLAVFPALTGDQFGLKNYGINYGIMYLAYGVGGVVAPVIADYLDFKTTYLICAGLMVATIFLNFLLKRDIASLAKQS
ncbi:MAG: OFA family MFS transporter [Leptospirales bacterium]|nr:OFA family MFS transporter [Leptospirales bacterium]